MTLREEILEFVARCPGRSATQIATTIGAKSQTVSSTLYMYVQTGVLERTLGKGPRGGYIYFIARAREPKRTNRFERILKD